MKTVIITQARMTSTRLPGKILKVVQGKTLLEHQIERLQRVPCANQILVATTANKTDNPVIELCERLQVPYYRGSEEDVLSRYYEAALQVQADIIVRVTSDCPVIDPEVVNHVIRYYLKYTPFYDYVSNVVERTYPRGMDTEVFSSKVLQEAYREATLPSDREHVTPFIFRQRSRYKQGNYTFYQNQSHHRWTVDVKEDLDLITNILNVLYPQKPTFDLRDILDLLEQHPEWTKINAHVEQKK